MQNKIDSILFQGSSNITIRYWSSDWGSEWEPHIQILDESLEIGVTAGRSSKGFHPFIIMEDGERAFALGVMWSGNWKISVKKVNSEIKIEVSGDDPLIDSFWVSTEIGGTDEVTKKFVEEFRLLNKLDKKPPLLTEWNPWWPYEDVEINEDVFLANAVIAKDVGIEVVVQDAGWFGVSEKESHWHDIRGDWDLENRLRFPSGIASVADQVRALGIEFGIWVEIEALSYKSQTLARHPEFLAEFDGESLLYLCLGNPAASAWAQAQLNRIIELTSPKWIKFDFNIEPNAGCNRTDHGHGIADGLASHIRELYRLLDDIREKYPEITLENCSSGGLRWDLGMAQHVDIGFASDTDWPEHALSCFWASSQFFAVEQLFGWVNSQWLGEHIHQKFEINFSQSTKELEFSFAISLLGGFGVSQRLPDFSVEQRKVLANFVALYKQEFRPRYQSEAVVRRLTSQPKREGLGERTVAFAIEATGFDPILMIYQLSGSNGGVIEYQVLLDGKYQVLNLINQRLSILFTKNGSLHFEVEAEEDRANIYAVRHVAAIGD